MPPECTIEVLCGPRDAGSTQRSILGGTNKWLFGFSHQRRDSTLAEQVASQIRLNWPQTYVDVVDNALVKDGPEGWAAPHKPPVCMNGRAPATQQLMAVVSSTTKGWYLEKSASAPRTAFG